MEPTLATSAADPAEPVPEQIAPDDERSETVADELREAIRRKLEPSA